MQKAFLIVALVAVLCLGVGCRTLALGTMQEVEIITDPPGAIVEIMGPQPEYTTTEISGGTAYIMPRPVWRALGETPVQTRLLRGQNYTVKITKEGYETVEYSMERTITWDYWVGNLFVPVVGHLMDWASGSAYYLTQARKVEPLRKSR